MNQAICGLVRLDEYQRADWRFVFYELLASIAGIGRSRHTELQDAEPESRLIRDSFRFDVPPRFQQRRIASILSAYDELIENNQRRIQILETMARALYREWFVEFRFPGHEKIPRMASPLGDIPQGWEVKKLGQIAENFDRIVSQKSESRKCNERRMAGRVSTTAQLRGVRLRQRLHDFDGEYLLVLPRRHVISVIRFAGTCSRQVLQSLVKEKFRGQTITVIRLARQATRSSTHFLAIGLSARWTSTNVHHRRRCPAENHAGEHEGR